MGGVGEEAIVMAEKRKAKKLFPRKDSPLWDQERREGDVFEERGGVSQIDD